MRSHNSAIVLILVLFVISCEDDDSTTNNRQVSQNNLSSTVNHQPKSNSASGRAADDFNQELYDGSVSGPINLNLAREWVMNYKHASLPDAIQSHYFGRNVIDQLLTQEGCTGLRIYYALDDKGDKVLIISGVDSNGENLVPESPTDQGGDYILADMSLPCPSVCPTKDL